MNKIKSLYSPALFKATSSKATEILGNYLENILEAKNGQCAYPYRDPEELRKKYRTILEKGTDFGSLLEEVLKDSNHLHHPGYIGHQCTVPNPLASVTSMAGGLLNNGSAVYEMGPANTAMEKVLARHFADEFGFPASADGIFTSGGSLGNLTALLAARQNNSPYDIWKEGFRADDRAVFLVSEGAHYSIERSLRIMGAGDNRIVRIPTGGDFRMDIRELERIMEDLKNSGTRIIALVSSACSTATGSYDDLEKISELCTRYSVWHHLDGAHGGAAILSPKYRHLLKGAGLADSIVIDFHKMLMTPGLNTLVLFRNEDDSYASFAQKASYLLDGDIEKDWYNMAKRTIECTKSMMGFNVYAQLAVSGNDIFGKNIEHLYDMGKVFADLCHETEDIELATQPDSNIVCFRFTGAEPGELDRINRAIREEILRKGDFYIVQTVLNEKQYLRVTIMNPFSDENIFGRLLSEIRESGYRLAGKQ